MNRTLGPLLLAALSTAVAANAQAIPTSTRERVAPAVPMQAAFFPLQDVRLLPGPFQEAQETDRAYLRRLDPDRLLSWMRKNAGLAPKAPPYAGWDRDGSGIIGHYLSACAQMTEATGDVVLKKRVDYVVSEMAACQAAGDGGLYSYAWDKETYFPKLRAGDVIPVDTSAWYVVHKLLAGLRDAYLLTGNVQARDVLVRLSDWSLAVTARLNPAQWQQMLGPPGKMGEFGGPHEVFADVYAITGEHNYLALAERFKHDVVFDPLAKGDASILNGRHANTEIPKFVGYERIYEMTGERVWHDAARSFWDDVTAERTWANGGNSQWEHFFAPGEFAGKMMEDCGPETCNTYNLLKLTQQLYALAPSARYVDYYERALYNHVLPSEAPGGGFAYYTPMRPGHYRVFSRDYDAFWCCVGTGMENHGKYGGMIYAHAPGRLYVNLFIPSTLKWDEEGLSLRQDTAFPEQPHTRLTLTLARPTRLTLSLRDPAWVGPGPLTIRVNGTPVKADARPDSFVDLTKVWRSGDRIDLGLPMRLTAEPLPGSPDYAAFFYGPVLLAGRLGTEGLTGGDFHGGGPFDSTGQTALKSIPESHVPVLVGTPAEAIHKILPMPGRPLTFQTRGLARPRDVSLIPLYRLFFERYALYWHVLPPAAYAELQNQTAQDQDVEARTLDRVRVGEADSEAAHGLIADRSSTGSAGEPFTHWRDAAGGFSYVLNVLPDQPVSLRCAYWGSDTRRVFDILVEGRAVATQTLTGLKPEEYQYVTYRLPEALTRGRQAVTVRFQAAKGSTAGGVYDCRIVRRR